MRTKDAVKVINPRRGFNSPAISSDRDNVACGLVRVVLVINLADNLLKHIFNRNQAGDGTELIDHERHMVSFQAEFFQKHVCGL